MRACKLAQVEYLCEIVFGGTFQKAIMVQLEENFHEAVPLSDLIRSTHAYWVMMKTENPLLTLKAFSEKVHRRPEWVRDALRFAELPLSIQSLLVYKGDKAPKGVPYHVLLEFAKLYEYALKKGVHIKEEMLLGYIFHAVASRSTLKEVRSFCESLRTELDGQDNFFTLEGESMDDGVRRNLAVLRREATLQLEQARRYLADNVGLADTIITRSGRRRATQVIDLSQKVLAL